MKTPFLLLTAVLILASGAVTSAQGVRTLAIADFVDETHGGIFIGASRMNADLEHLLIARGGGRVRVVASNQVRAAMRAQGATAHDLVSPTRAIAIAQAVGAEWIITGRWTRLDAEPSTIPSPQNPEMEIPSGILEAAGALEIRVLEAATRRIVLRESFFSEVHGVGPSGALWRAAQQVLLMAADRILRL